MITPQEYIDLHPLTTFRVGGKARYFVEAKTEADTIEALQWAKEKKVNVFVLGGGSNVLFSDSGWDGLVIKVEMNDLADLGEGRLRVGAGVALHSAVECARDHGYGGIERLAGIPGTIGGALTQGVAGEFHPVTMQNLWPMLAVGLAAMLAQLAMTRAYHSGNTLLVGAFAYSTVIFAALAGWLFFDESLPPVAWLGMFIVIVSGLLAKRATSSDRAKAPSLPAEED